MFPRSQKNAPHIPSKAAGPRAAPTLSRPGPGLPQRSTFPSQALIYRLGLNRRVQTPAFTQHSATHAGSFTAQSAPPNHLHLIILAFGHATKGAGGKDKQGRGAYREPVTQDSKTGRRWENLKTTAAVLATSASLQTLAAAADAADVTRRGGLRYLWLVSGVEDERPHVGPQPGGTALPAVLLGRRAVLL